MRYLIFSDFCTAKPLRGIEGKIFSRLLLCIPALCMTHTLQHLNHCYNEFLIRCISANMQEKRTTLEWFQFDRCSVFTGLRKGKQGISVEFSLKDMHKHYR